MPALLCKGRLILRGQGLPGVEKIKWQWEELFSGNLLIADLPAESISLF